jgi:hypothetical protein
MKRYLTHTTVLTYKVRQYPIIVNSSTTNDILPEDKPESNPNNYDSQSLAKGYEMGWTKALKTFKQAKESVRKTIINDFNINIDLLRDQIYAEREKHVTKHKLKIAQ